MGRVRLLLATGAAVVAAAAFAAASLPGTAPLTLEGDLSDRMVAGIDRFLETQTRALAGQRAEYWKVDYSDGRDAYERSVQPNRERLAGMLGLIDPRVADPELELIATPTGPALLGETDRCTVQAVRWRALDGLTGEGLLLQPKGRIVAHVIALPDADQVPEVLAGLAGGDQSGSHAYALRLAESGCEVVVPVLIDRSDTFSGNPSLKQFTNHPHREWIYRQSFVLGRHPIGYELQKLRALVDWFARPNQTERIPIGIVGWGEGGLLAFHAAATDPRIEAALVSGYFGPRERLWQEPIYRNIFGLLREFGDAEVARLIAPRALLVEHSAPPRVDGPPPPRPRRSGAAPGRIVPLSFADVRDEFARARELAGPFAAAFRIYHGPDGQPLPAVSDEALLGLLQALSPGIAALAATPDAVRVRRPSIDPAVRQERQLREMERYTQRRLQLADRERDAFLWSQVIPTSVPAWETAMQPYRARAWDERIGRFPLGDLPLHPRTRVIHERPTWTGYEVVLDVLPEVIAWGYLLVPKGLAPGERRPVVVAQHGVGGRPESVVNEDPASRNFATYRAFAVQLVERGFIVFAPHNPYRGDDASRVLQRKAQPLGRTIFSIILAQHERILDFLSARPEVDPARIGFYGLSYGGQTAMRVPILLERYALAICSGDFNEWTWKNASTEFPKSYMYNAAYERPEFRMGLTFGYAEMAALMVPRPFMVERGHRDGVGIDEWVAFEYAKVFRLYHQLGIADRTAIEYFEGPHTIHGVGTFRFLHRHLDWPEPAGAAR